MKRKEYFLDFEKLETIISDEYIWFTPIDKANFKYEFFKQTYFTQKSKSFKCPVMLFLGNKKFSMKYELEVILKLIKNGSTKAETDYFRKHFKENDTTILCKQFLYNFKSFTPCGIFYSRKSRIEIRKLNGILLLQNNITDLTEEHCNQIKNDKFTYAFFRLLQPNRFAILVKTNGMTSKNYKQFQNFIQNYYNDLLNEKILYQTQINSAIYLASDEKIYVNDNSINLSGKLKIKKC